MPHCLGEAIFSFSHHSAASVILS
uniref:Uncharacterized protein n=1 Tax=Anguilla anguilla TaxID=7936 RepID=A0A0E9TC87_ANGAN